MILIDGKKIRDDILASVKKEVAGLSFQPVFCDVLVGENKVSRQYVELKKNFAQKAGMKFYEAYFGNDIKEGDLIKEIEKINNLQNICGLIVQLPLPLHLDVKKVLSHIKAEIDVDSLSDNFENGPTGKAVAYLLDSLGLHLSQKKILIIGTGPLVGVPVAKILEKRGLNFNVMKSNSENKLELMKNADIIITGAGDPNFIKGDMIKEGVVLLDAGTSEDGGGIVGDVDLESVANKALYVSPVPGGVGPVTVAMLLKNILAVAKTKHE